MNFSKSVMGYFLRSNFIVHSCLVFSYKPMILWATWVTLIVVYPLDYFFNKIGLPLKRRGEVNLHCHFVVVLLFLFVLLFLLLLSNRSSLIQFYFTINQFLPLVTIYLFANGLFSSSQQQGNEKQQKWSQFSLLSSKSEFSHAFDSIEHRLWFSIKL